MKNHAKLSVPQVNTKKLVEIVSELKTLFSGLTAVAQEDFEANCQKLQFIAERLIEDKLLKHPDRSVRLLVVCCCAHILRLFAPEAPYSNEQIYDIFSIAISHLKTLGDTKNAYYSYVFCLVESLATFKSIVLLHNLDNEDLLVTIFRLAFDLVTNPSVSNSPARLHLLDILQTLIEEADGPPSPQITEIILSNCGAIQRIESRLFVTDLLSSSPQQIGTGIATIINSSYLEYCSSNSPQKLENLRKIHTQIIESCHMAPPAFLPALALFEEELLSADVDLRTMVTVTLASLFSNPSLISEYSSCWASWLQKSNDRLAHARISWAKCACDLLPTTSANPLGMKQLQEAISERMIDQDARVRERVLFHIGGTLAKPSLVSNTILSETMVEEIIERCRDKSEDVRLAAVNCLCTLIISSVKKSPALFSQASNGLFNLLYTSDRDLRIYYEYFLEHSLFLPGESPSSPFTKSFIQRQAEMYLEIFGALETTGRKAFRRWLHDKARVTKYFSAFIKLASTDNTDPRLVIIAPHLSDCFRLPLDAMNMLQAICESICVPTSNNNPTIKLARDYIERIADPNASVKSLIKMIDSNNNNNIDWPRLDARLQPYLITFISRRASLLSVNKELLEQLANVETESSRLLIEDIIAEFPSISTDYSCILESMIMQHLKSPSIVAPHLQSYNQFTKALSKRIKPTFAQFLESLRSISVNYTEFAHIESDLPSAHKCSKLAISIICNLNVDFDWSQFTNAEHPINWHVLSNLSKHLQLDIAPITLISLIQSLFKSVNLTQKYAKIIDCDQDTANFVMAIKCTTNTILKMNSDNESKMTMLRSVAPLLVQYTSDCGESPLIVRTICKSLIKLVPKPSIIMLKENLNSIVDCILIKSQYHKISSFILTNYTAGGIGMIYLSLIFFCPKEQSLAALANLRRNDHESALIPNLDGKVIEINSRRIKKWEQLYIVSIILYALFMTDPTNDDLFIDSLLKTIAYELNISYLFDASVQLKSMRFVARLAPETESIKIYNHRLYRLSEISQKLLRTAATQHKWPLGAVSSSISFNDESLELIQSSEKITRNLNRSYLVPVSSARLSKSISTVDLADDDDHQNASVDPDPSEIIDENNVNTLNLPSPNKMSIYSVDQKSDLENSERTLTKSLVLRASESEPKSKIEPCHNLAKRTRRNTSKCQSYAE